MTRLPTLRGLTLALLTTASASAAATSHAPVAGPTPAAPDPAPGRIERIEPPFWWVGMHHRRLQLMVHGDHAGDWRAHVRYPGVRVDGSTSGDSRNYLFVDLTLSPEARPGTMTIEFTRGGASSSGASADPVVATARYELEARAPGSADRAGFGPADAVYLLVPDRFADGDPTNDRVAGVQEAAHRQDASGRHGGDLAGVIAHLDYLRDMGFTQLWPTPVETNDQPAYSYHGYAITDFYRVDPRLGTNDDYLRLAREARARGIGLIHDVVLNHIGSGHWWMKDLPTRDWVNHAPPAKPVMTSHAHIAALDPHGTRADREAFTTGWFDDSMPDLNPRQPRLAEYLVQNTIWWIEWAGLSGIREDTFSYSDAAFLATWAQRVREEYPRLTLVGEEMSDDAAMVAYWQARRPGGPVNPGGYDAGMPSMMDFLVHQSIRDALAGPEGMQQGLYQVHAALAHDWLYPDASRLMLFAGNHDRTRIAAHLDGDLARVRLALAMVATLPRIPQFFYGDEIGLAGPKRQDDGALRMDFPGGWPGDAVDGFSGRGLGGDARALQTWLRTLLNWRKGSAAIARGRYTQYVPPGDGTWVYFRHDPGLVMVAINRADHAATLDLSRFSEVLDRHPGATGTDVLTGRRVALSAAGRLSVPAKTVLVLDASPR